MLSAPAEDLSAGAVACAEGVAGLLGSLAAGGALAVDCWVFFGQCLFVFQAAFVKSRKSRSASFGARYPRAE